MGTVTFPQAAEVDGAPCGGAGAVGATAGRALVQEQGIMQIGMGAVAGDGGCALWEVKVPECESAKRSTGETGVAEVRCGRQRPRLRPRAQP